MSVRFEHSFNNMLADLVDGKLRSLKINLSKKPLTKRNIKKLADALDYNFHITSHITEINLSFTGISELPDDIFKDCDSLRRLNLENNNLIKLPNLPDRPYALKDFYASNNPLKKISEKYFAHCISLQTVYLDGTQIEKPPEFADSLSLAWLHLNDNPIHKFPEKYFLYLQELDTIFINDTKLKELPNLLPCKNLQEVWIDNIKIPRNHVVNTAQVIKCSDG